MREKSVVLIVDDNPTNLSVLFNALRDSEFKVLAAQDGASAIQQAQHIKPDIILLDVMMPGLNGFETCKRIKDNPETRDIPVIFMTALSDINDKVNGFNVGAVDYVTKPLQHEEVVMRLSTHLRLRQMSELLRNKNAEMDMANRELKKNFDEVTRLQNIVKSYLSNRAWQSIETAGIQKTENGAVEAETLTVMMCDIEGFT
ncbi:MAG: response regulator, partial [Bacteroidetes bacterium]|nr:response regulator [Bacteroidota bacterium]